ncbi:hypothetical protein F511_35692 [Dorcoceras hygrometricum]|uniref:Uncharacterized protein n=1 Tax=Dorcoceras hygrometricum TaxID=472368 RepID=A0A2Z7AH46_9LAMI|nr:hypothetical protein F511_35692 [Dorcoceras hygrometricum]
MICARWIVPEGVALVSCENMQVGSDVREDVSAGATEPAGAQRWISWRKDVNESDVNVKRNLESAMMTSTLLLEEAVISNGDISRISNVNSNLQQNSATLTSRFCNVNKLKSAVYVK